MKIGFGIRAFYQTLGCCSMSDCKPVLSMPVFHLLPSPITSINLLWILAIYEDK